jgi:type I restriction enzyme, S subunit
MKRIPPNTECACAFSTSDTEVTALEAKLSKAQQVKAGMMSELLTGRIRLVES